MCEIFRDIPKTFLRASLSWHLVRLPILLTTVTKPRGKYYIRQYKQIKPAYLCLFSSAGQRFHLRLSLWV